MDSEQPPQVKPPVTPITVRKGLGRGLDALLPSSPGVAPSASGGVDAVRQIPLSHIVPNSFQPRTVFKPEKLRELADSIRVHGVMQPIVVRKMGDRFMLIAGERRWRASSLAGLVSVPALIREVPNNQVLELTLIENIQREDLNPVETAEAFQRLATETNLTHDQIAERTGKDRSTVTNLLRLLKLPAEVRSRIVAGEVTLGHAKVLLSLATDGAQKSLAARIAAQGLSVRQLEEIVKRVGESAEKGTGKRAISTEGVADPNVRAAIVEIERMLGARVHLKGNQKKGRMVIEYNSAEELDRIYSRIVGRK
jgi:ParB family transcriptional regulator, chromosome partitioning protein